MALTIHDTIQKDRENQRKYWEKVPTYRKYSNGDVANPLTKEQKEILQGILGHTFSDNVCHQVVAEAQARVELKSWECEDEKVKSFLDDLFSTARITDRSGEIHYDAFRDGNHAVGVGWSNNKKRVRIFREPWYDGAEGVFIAYNDEDEPVYAVKDWMTDDDPPRYRRNVWFPNRLERYISTDGISWTPNPLPIYDADGNFVDMELWPFPWVKDDGRPLGIPYIHFPNSGRGTGNYGASEFFGGVLAFQDQINDLQFAMSACGRMTGYQMYYGTGIPTDAELDIGAGQFLKASKPDARFGTLQAGDLKQQIELYFQKLKAVARLTRTPLHVITGDWPSGEALLRAEMPAIGKANRQVAKVTDCWVEVAHRATEVGNRFGNAGLNEDVKVARILAKFENTERRDPLSRSIIVKNTENFISTEEGLRIMGYIEEKIQQIMQERKAKEDADFERQQSMFDRGTGAGTNVFGDQEDL